MKTFRTAASLMLLVAMIIAASVDMSAFPRFGVDVIHSFAGADGSGPYAALMQATDGNYYGTTSQGGASNMGTVFKMTLNGSVTVLHSFAGGASDGASPFAPLIQATDGNFYGTTYSGGASDMGTVFMLTPGGAYTQLYAFTGGPQDGRNPRAALLQTNDGSLYGTTQFGGTADRGTLFAMTTTGTVIARYIFTGGFDGAYPYAPLIQTPDGSVYGTNYGATSTTFGRVFKLVGGVFSVVHTFIGGAADGANPAATVVLGKDGNFYGTTLFGGAFNNGTAFKMTPGGIVTVLASFSGGSDGANPGSALIQAADGNLYGTTKVGGSSAAPLGYGTIFKLTTAGTLSVVHAFTGGTDGAVSNASLIQAPDGKLYGTTAFGGASGKGIVLRLPVAAPGDFDGGTKSDITVFRPSNGTWYIRYSETQTGASFAWGGAGDIPVLGDYDGDGKTDIAVFRPSNGTWYIRYSSTTTSVALAWGGGVDIPVPGDYDGDGITDIAVFRPSNGTWFIRNSSTTTSTAVAWGGGADIPVPADFDGDGKIDIAVFRPSNGTWYIRYSATLTGVALPWGGGADVPVASDYDGDGIADLAVFRPSNGTWYIRYSSTPTSAAIAWGGGSDVPVPGDFDGDGRTDIAVFRPSTGTWYILYSATPTSASVVWGVSTDIPVLKRP